MAVDRLTVRKPEKHEFEDVIEFVIKDFIRRELLSTFVASEMDNIGIEENKQHPSYHRYLTWLMDDVSLIAIDEETNTIAGISLNCIARREESQEDETLSQVPTYILPVLKFIDKLEEGYNVFDELDTDQGMDLRFLGVKESYSNQGIARRLSEETIKLARQSGMKFVHSIPTNPITIHLFEVLGFETKSELKCVDFFMDDGEPAFPRAKSTDICRYVVKIL